MDYKDNLEIDLIDLAQYILKKWKIMLVGMILGGLLLGGYSYMKSGVAVDKSTGEQVTATESSLDEYKSKLTDSSAQLIEATAKKYFDFINDYNNYVDYSQNSILMKLDPQNVAKLTRVYAIDEESDETLMVQSDKAIIVSNCDSIVALYRRELTGDDVIKSVKKAISSEADNLYLRELISIDTEGANLLSISVYGEDEKMCKAIMKVVEGKVDAATQKISAIYDYEIKPVDSYLNITADDILRNKQTQNSSNVTNIRSSIASLTSNMTEDEKKYYTELITAGDASDAADVTADAENTDKIEVVTVRSLNKKYILIGLLGGLFAVAFAYALCYVLSGKLHTSDDLKSAFGLSVLGEVSGSNPEVDLVSQSAAIIAEKLTCNKIYVMGASGDEVSDKIRKDICDKLEKQNHVEDAKFGSCAINDALSMKYLSDSDSVVLVERIDSSSYADIEKEIELCKSFEVKILGAVAIK